MSKRSYNDWPERHELTKVLNALPIAVSTGNAGHADALCRRLVELVNDGLTFVLDDHRAPAETAAPAEPETASPAERDEPADQPGDDGDDDDDDDDKALLAKIAELDYYANHTALGAILFSRRPVS
jgi:hypothetical protein